MPASNTALVNAADNSQLFFFEEEEFIEQQTVNNNQSDGLPESRSHLCWLPYKNNTTNI